MVTQCTHSTLESVVGLNIMFTRVLLFCRPPPPSSLKSHFLLPPPLASVSLSGFPALSIHLPALALHGNHYTCGGPSLLFFWPDASSLLTVALSVTFTFVSCGQHKGKTGPILSFIFTGIFICTGHVGAICKGSSMIVSLAS